LVCRSGNTNCQPLRKPVHQQRVGVSRSPAHGHRPGRPPRAGGVPCRVDQGQGWLGPVRLWSRLAPCARGCRPVVPERVLANSGWGPWSSSDASRLAGSSAPPRCLDPRGSSGTAGRLRRSTRTAHRVALLVGHVPRPGIQTHRTASRRDRGPASITANGGRPAGVSGLPGSGLG